MKSHRGTSLKKPIRRIRTGAAKKYPQALPQGQWDRSEDYRKATRATRNQEAAIRLRPAPLLEIWLNSDYFPKESNIVHIDATVVYPFPDGTFDYAYSERMIEHVPYPAGYSILKKSWCVLTWKTSTGRPRVHKTGIVVLEETKENL